MAQANRIPGAAAIQRQATPMRSQIPTNRAPADSVFPQVTRGVVPAFLTLAAVIRIREVFDCPRGLRTEGVSAY